MAPSLAPGELTQEISRELGDGCGVDGHEDAGRVRG